MDFTSFENNDRLLVSALINYDDCAWTYLITEIVNPIALCSRLPIREIFLRHAIPIDSIGGQVFLDLQKNDFTVLRKFRFECRFRSYMYLRIYDAAQKIVRKKIGKIDFVLSDLPIENPLKEGKESSYDLQTKDDVKEANTLLMRLWENNPTQALVLLLKHDVSLSSKEVGRLLGKTSSNIDQINKRAKETIKSYRQGDL